MIEKYEKGGYNLTNDDGKESSKVGKLLNNNLFRDNVRLAATEDYNNNCK